MLALTTRSQSIREWNSTREDSYGWDWTATTHDALGTTETVASILDTLVTVLDPAHVVPGKGLQGWSSSVQAYDAEGYRIGNVYYGGERTDVHVVATSEAASLVRPRVAGLFGAKTSRVDTRVDTLLGFAELCDLAADVAGPRTKVTYMESSVGGESTGRTLYVGSPTSDVRVRIYEKWLESPGQYEDGTNRVEVQLRPPSRGKADVSEWLPGETFCATKLTRRLAAELQEHVYEPGTLQKAKGTPDLEKTLEAMGNQYGSAVDRWLRQSGGDIGTVLDRLGATSTRVSGERARQQ